MELNLVSRYFIYFRKYTLPGNLAPPFNEESCYPAIVLPIQYSSEVIWACGGGNELGACTNRYAV